jgi:hypothetical protein
MESYDKNQFKPGDIVIVKSMSDINFFAYKGKVKKVDNIGVTIEPMERGSFPISTRTIPHTFIERKKIVIPFNEKEYKKLKELEKDSW